MPRLRSLVPACAAIVAACGGDDDLPTKPPEALSMVASGGFDSPMDAVASPDGKTFYFTAHDLSESAYPPGAATLFSVAAEGGAVAALYSGAPLEDPSGLVISCDGTTLIVSDLSFRVGTVDVEIDGEKSPLHAMQVDGGELTALAANGIGEAAGLAIGPDCETLYVSGYDESGEPALFTLPIDGGTASVVASGDPLQSPSGVHVDADSVAWVMDHLPQTGLGGGLWAITPDGDVTSVLAGMTLAEPAGVSLVAGGGTAVIAARDEDSGQGQLITVNLDSGEQTIVASAMVSPAGLRTARKAGVFAVADHDGDAIYRAE